MLCSSDKGILRTQVFWPIHPKFYANQSGSLAPLSAKIRSPLDRFRHGLASLEQWRSWVLISDLASSFIFSCSIDVWNAAGLELGSLSGLTCLATPTFRFHMATTTGQEACLIPASKSWSFSAGGYPHRVHLVFEWGLIDTAVFMNRPRRLGLNSSIVNRSSTVHHINHFSSQIHPWLVFCLPSGPSLDGG